MVSSWTVFAKCFPKGFLDLTKTVTCLVKPCEMTVFSVRKTVFLAQELSHHGYFYLPCMLAEYLRPPEEKQIVVTCLAQPRCISPPHSYWNGFFASPFLFLQRSRWQSSPCTVFPSLWNSKFAWHEAAHESVSLPEHSIGQYSPRAELPFSKYLQLWEVSTLGEVFLISSDCQVPFKVLSWPLLLNCHRPCLSLLQSLSRSSCPV